MSTRYCYKGYFIDTDDSGYAPAALHWQGYLDGEPVRFFGPTREAVEQQIDEAEAEHWLEAGPNLLAAVQDLLYHLAPDKVPAHLKPTVDAVRLQVRKARSVFG